MYSGVWEWLWWFIFGAVIGSGVTLLWAMVKDRVSFKWYEWALVIVTALLLAFTSETFVGSLAERETTAAWWSLLFLGFPTVILALLTFRSVKSRLS